MNKSPALIGSPHDQHTASRNPEHRRLDRYSTMDVADIKTMPVADVAAKNAHLYLWVPNALLPEGLEVMKAWGFLMAQFYLLHIKRPNSAKTCTVSP